MATTPKSGKGVFTRPVMARVAYVASPIPRLVCVEVVKALRPALRQRPSVTVMRIKAAVDMAIKAVRAVKPGASSKKHPANKPIGSIVAVRSTGIPHKRAVARAAKASALTLNMISPSFVQSFNRDNLRASIIPKDQ
jgi:hypothetical protein